ncbi:reverse transcriptase [Trichonephila clavipes]|nr:reverse transcriptase [Trichonephila clavipes]
MGWFCRLFESSLAVGKNAIDFDDSQAAILALSCNPPTDCLNTIQCRNIIADLISYGWTAALQWIASDVGIPGNKRADQKAKQGAEPTQMEFFLTLRRAKSIISTHIDKYTAMTQKTKSFGSGIQDDLLVHNNVVCGEPIKQVVLSAYKGKENLQMVHEIPLAGHLREQKTTQSNKYSFFWPSLKRDLKTYCEAWKPCQLRRIVLEEK